MELGWDDYERHSSPYDRNGEEVCGGVRYYDRTDQGWYCLPGLEALIPYDRGIKAFKARTRDEAKALFERAVNPSAHERMARENKKGWCK